jgi:hypothetical protein
MPVDPLTRQSNALVSLTVLALGCLSCANARRPAAEPDKGTVMNELRIRLDEVARARTERGSKPADFNYSGCPLVLVRVTQAEILARLGQPDRSDSCSKTDKDCLWEYSFYYLPEHWDGGGGELDLHFNLARVISKVECVQTQ